MQIYCYPQCSNVWGKTKLFRLQYFFLDTSNKSIYKAAFQAEQVYIYVSLWGKNSKQQQSRTYFTHTAYVQIAGFQIRACQHIRAKEHLSSTLHLFTNHYFMSGSLSSLTQYLCSLSSLSLSLSLSLQVSLAAELKSLWSVFSGPIHPHSVDCLLFVVLRAVVFSPLTSTG